MKRYIIISLFVAGGLIIGLILSRIFFVPFVVTDASMLPNFNIGDRIIIMKVSGTRPGDAVLIKSPVETDRVLFKRIIASEGDTIEIINKTIYINNKKLDVPWKTKSIDRRVLPMSFTYRDAMPMLKINRNEYFVIGDNPDYSFDSRSFGVVPEEAIIGKLLYTF